MGDRSLKGLSREEFWNVVNGRRIARMNQIDGLPPDIRACVHDYGWNVVKMLIDLGVKKPRHIRHVVETVLDEFSPTRGTSSAQGIRADMGIRASHPLAIAEASKKGAAA